ncbi:hypothetical protein [Saccharobesus litoralis]|nr:hypothetical protein [Saccharobesus litoralis]
MRNRNEIKTIQASPEICQVVADGQRLITYIARNGNKQLDPIVTQNVIDAKYKIVNDEWTMEDEQAFLINYDKLAKAVYPVTVESIYAVIPADNRKNRPLTKAERAVAWYRRYTMVALFFLLLIQVFFLFGEGLNTNLTRFFSERQTLLEQSRTQPENDKLLEEIKLLDQKIDANYNLLLMWNRVWSFGGTLSVDVPKYSQKKFEIEEKALQRKLEQSHLALDPREFDHFELAHSLYEARLIFFGNLLSAEAVLKVLQVYILPLLYGLLGAFIFVLRSLLKEVRDITYTYDCEIRYRLRLTLGALGGMIIGWFLKPEEIHMADSVSSMALAFLMGYNVDILFSIMDKLVNNIKQAVEKPEANSDKTKPEPAPSTASAKT